MRKYQHTLCAKCNKPFTPGCAANAAAGLCGPCYVEANATPKDLGSPTWKEKEGAARGGRNSHKNLKARKLETQ